MEIIKANMLVKNGTFGCSESQLLKLLIESLTEEKTCANIVYILLLVTACYRKSSRIFYFVCTCKGYCLQTQQAIYKYRCKLFKQNYMKDKINRLDSDLKLVVEKYENNAPVFNNDFKSIFDRFSYFSSLKKEFVTDLNSVIDPFITENQKQMTIHEISYMNQIIRKHERTLLYGFKFPSDMEQ